jgi:hypothetical protein
MMFYVWPLAKRSLKFILIIGAQTLLVPVLTFTVQGIWFQVGSRSNLLDARIAYYQARERAMSPQISFKQINYTNNGIGRPARPIGAGAD